MTLYRFLKRSAAPGGLLCILLLTLPLGAQETEAPPPAGENQANLPVEERMSILEQELEKVKLQKATKQYKSVEGRGVAASEVYHSTEGLTWGGYGEVKYRNFKSSYRKDQADLHRFILYAGYRFNDWIVMNTEIEYEHAGIEKTSAVSSVDFTGRTTKTTTFNQAEVFVEFAYLDFEFTKAFQLQLGLNLLPVGITNYRHEPTTFLPVERARVETDLIPSTWREIGALFHGEIGELVQYRAGIVNGPAGSGFSESTWIRGGRQGGSLSVAESWGYVASIDFTPVDGLLAGGSYYAGDSGQGEVSKLTWTDRLVNPLDSISSGPLKDTVTALNEIQTNRKKHAAVRVHLSEGHIDYNAGPVMLRALYAKGWMSEDDARAVNRNTGKNIGKVVDGGYAEAGFNVLSFAATSHKLYPYVRYERLNTQRETVQRYAGGKEDLSDFLCSVVAAGTCKTTDQLTQKNRTLGVIENSTTAKEAYGVKGVADRVNDRRIVTLGLAYYPHPSVVLKGEFEWWNSKTDHHTDIDGRNTNNNKIDRINVGLGFIF